LAAVTRTHWQTALRLPRGFHVHCADQGFDILGIALGTLFLVIIMLTDGLEHVEFMTAFIAFKFIGRHVTVPLQIGPISLNTTLV